MKHQTIMILAAAALFAGPARADISVDDLQWSITHIVDNDDLIFGLDQGPGAGRPRSVRGLALSPDGNYLYLGFNQDKQVRKFDLSATDPADSCAVVAELYFGTLSVGEQAGYTGTYLPDALDNPKAIATDDVGRVYVTRSSEIQIYDADLTGLLLSITGFSTTNGVHVERKGPGEVYVYAADRGLPEVYRMVLSEAGIAGGGSVTRASVLDAAFDGDGIVDVGLDSAGNPSNDLRGLAVDQDGNVWAAENDGTLFEIVPAAGDGASTVMKRALSEAFDVAICDDQVFVASGSRTITVVDRTDISTILDTITPLTGLALLEPGVGSSTGIDLIAGDQVFLAIEGGSSAPQSGESSFSDVNCDGPDANPTADDDNDPVLRGLVVLPAVRNVETSETFLTIQEAIDDPDTLNGHTLEMLLPEHTEGPQIHVTKSITLRGGSVDTIKAAGDTGSSGDARGWFLVDAGVELHVEDLIFDGNGHLIWQAFRHLGTGSFTNCEFTDIKYNESGPHYSGVAVAAFGTSGPVDFTGCVFSEIGRVGVLYFGSGINGSVYSGCTYTGKGDGDFLDYALDISAGAEVFVEDSFVADNRGVASSDGSTSAGYLVTTYYAAGTSAVITGCTVIDNTTGIFAGYDSSDTSDVTANFNNIYGNTSNGVANTSATTIVNAKDNWWGDAAGPDDPPGTIPAINGFCADPADIYNLNPPGDAVTDLNVCYCPWAMIPLGGPPAGNLTLEIPDCPDDAHAASGYQIAVEVWMRDLTTPSTGFQAFISYDTGTLSYRSDLSTYTSTPFPLHIQPISTAEITPGALRIDGSDSLGDPGTVVDSLLATLVFDVDVDCSTTSVDFDLAQPFDSELSYEGNAIPTTLVNTGAFDLDDTPPSIGPCPGVTVASDASIGDGCQGAYVTFSDPPVSDNCPDPVAVDCVPPSGSFFGVGTTAVTCTATDACGNTDTCMFDVTVTATNLVDVEVELVGVDLEVDRCIHFVTDDCGNTTDVELSFTDHDSSPATPVRAIATIEIGCGNWTFLCAKDQQHTQWSTTTLTQAGTGYTADYLLSLEPGDTDNDGDVDINDVTLVVVQFGTAEPAGGCPWNGSRGADFSDDGNVFSEDYSLLVSNWLTTSGCACTMPNQPPFGEPVLTSISTSALAPSVAAAADLNHDAIVDWRDVAIFEQRHGLPGLLSARMLATERASGAVK